ncbi:MAG: hypothetical protein H6714_03085 [Myxococcales bacterium]|nr:hypothetical protein [Myxococcales bacterium]
MQVLRIGFLTTFALLCTQCGAGQLHNGRYNDSEASYRVGRLGPSWQRIDVDDDNDLAWHNPRAGAVIQVNASCSRDLDIPLVALTNHLLMGFTERHIRSQQLIALDSREALLTRLDASLDGQPRELALVVLKKNGCVFDFSLIARPSARSGDLFSSFKTFVSGFSV